MAFHRRFGIEPAYQAIAPGRVEFIGNHTDYNGGEVLGAAIDRFLEVAVAPRNDRAVRLASDGQEKVFEWESTEDAVKDATGWTRYPLGVLSLLMGAGALEPPGFDFLVRSEIPLGAGLSSSAAFELASCLAFEYLCDHPLDSLSRVRLCRRAENEFVGVPCGILDQGVSGFGEEGRLVHIDCATEIIHTVPGPEDSVLWIFESGHKHSLVDSLYARRHAECREAWEAIRTSRPDLQWLAHARPEDLEAARSAMSPEAYRRARHVIAEHARVRRTVEELAAGDLDAVGAFLTESHRSSAELFENSIDELDTLVSLLDANPAVRGARLTGGGFGGAVMALCDRDFAEKDAEEVATAFGERHGNHPVRRRLRIADGARGGTLG